MEELETVTFPQYSVLRLSAYILRPAAPTVSESGRGPAGLGKPKLLLIDELLPVGSSYNVD